MSRQRPTGLVVLAVINFVFAALTVPSLLLHVFAPQVLEQGNLQLNVYTILSPTITAALLVTSGIGFLRMSYKLGFIVGLVFAIGSLLNILVFNALRGFQGFQLHIPSMIYPVVLILLLTIRYRGYFESSPQVEGGESGSAL